MAQRRLEGLHLVSGDRDRAHELARKAADVYEAQSKDKELAAVKGWLEEHR